MVNIAALRWFSWAITWLICIAIFDFSLYGAWLMLAGVFTYQLARFVDYMVEELAR